MSRVLLVTPPYHARVVESAGVWPPLALAYLAGGLRARGHEAEVYDAMSLEHDHAQIARVIEDRRPDVVALGAFTAAVEDCARVCATAKAVNPATVTVLGHVHATFMWREVLDSHPAVDYCIRGEGDLTLPELVDCLAAGGDPGAVAGIALRDGGVPRATPGRAFAPDLDALPCDYDALDWSLYSYRPKPRSVLAIVSSARGCQQQCSFCSQQLMWQRSWRGRRPEAFVADLELLKRRHGVDVVMLPDEIPTLERPRWERILDLLIERDLGQALLMETRVDDVLRDADLLAKYRRAGVEHIYIGVESPRPENLEAFHKGIEESQSRRAIQLINDAGIISETSFVLGMPDETPETIASTLAIAKQYGPDMAFFLAIAPWPYADIYPKLREHIVEHDYRKYNLVEPVVKPTAMSLDDLRRAIGNANREFYADRIGRIDTLPRAKQEFLVSLMDLLVQHSYLAAQMEGLEAGAMPPAVKEMLKQLARTKAALKASGSAS